MTQRLEGTDGLAGIARSTKRSDDFRAWAQALVEARDWQAALTAYEEAAETVPDKSFARGDFLDGAALAARELGRRDLPVRFERAWRIEPSLLRLHRWLGSASNKVALKKRVAAAVEACPKKEHCQLAFLHVLSGDMVSAAKLLAGAPGLGWSRSEHPGHLLFPMFCRLLGGTVEDLGLDTGYGGPAILSLTPQTENSLIKFAIFGRFRGDSWVPPTISQETMQQYQSCESKMRIPDGGHRGMDMTELEMHGENGDEPRLHTPSEDDVLALAGINRVEDSSARAAMLETMREAARKRLAGVTENKRRRHYGHAASLAVACAALDSTGGSVRWLAKIRDEYRRYPALQREFDRLARGR